MSILKQCFSGNRNIISSKVRVCFAALTVLHLIFLMSKSLAIDFTKSEDSNVKVYCYKKWKLITSWVNLGMFLYYPFSMYCEWRESRREVHWRHVQVLNQIRHAFFCNILLPATLFTDTLFWRLWVKDRTLIMPAGVDEFVPYWMQHSLHTVSMLVVLVDLVITPRSRPKSLKPGVLMMCLFLAAYLFMCYINWIQGEYIYPFLEAMSNIKIVCLIISIYTENLLYFTIQWIVVDFVWGDGKVCAKQK